MAAKYIVSTEVTFSASHSLRGYRGDCARVHGHNWIVRASYEFSDLDSEGITVDYRELRSQLERVILQRFDHRHLNEVPPFDRINPTSEHLAAEIFRLCKTLVSMRGVLREIALWESPTDFVRYSED